jgi:hypothetical protein
MVRAGWRRPWPAGRRAPRGTPPGAHAPRRASPLAALAPLPLLPLLLLLLLLLLLAPPAARAAAVPVDASVVLLFTSDVDGGASSLCAQMARRAMATGGRTVNFVVTG